MSNSDRSRQCRVSIVGRRHPLNGTLKVRKIVILPAAIYVGGAADGRINRSVYRCPTIIGRDLCVSSSEAWKRSWWCSGWCSLRRLGSRCQWCRPRRSYFTPTNRSMAPSPLASIPTKQSCFESDWVYVRAESRAKPDGAIGQRERNQRPRKLYRMTDAKLLPTMSPSELPVC